MLNFVIRLTSSSTETDAVHNADCDSRNVNAFWFKMHANVCWVRQNDPTSNVKYNYFMIWINSFISGKLEKYGKRHNDITVVHAWAEMRIWTVQ